MADSTYIRNDFSGFNFGYEYYNGKQIFKNAWTQNVIDDEVAKMRHSGLITDIDLEIVKFAYHNSFITSRIARDLLMPDKTVEEVDELRQVICDYYARRVDEEVDKLWESGQWDDKKNEAVLNEHLRTPYEYAK
jgi:hypothetical protein